MPSAATKPKAAKEPKAPTSPSVRLSCRVSPVTKSRAEQAARVMGQTITHFTEEAIAARAEEVLARHERIVLSERDFAAFVEAINSPPAPPTPGLLAAIADYDKRHNIAVAPTP